MTGWASQGREYQQRKENPLLLPKLLQHGGVMEMGNGETQKDWEVDVREGEWKPGMCMFWLASGKIIYRLPIGQERWGLRTDN